MWSYSNTTLLSVTFLLIGLMISLPVVSQVDEAHERDINRVETTSGLNRIIDEVIDRLERELMFQFKDERSEPDHGESSPVPMTLGGQRGAIHFTGNVFIDHRDRIEGNVVVRNGSITVRGRIYGDISVINGDAYVEEGGLVRGSITTINGVVARLDGEVTGGITKKDRVDADIAWVQRTPAYRPPYRLYHQLQDDLIVRDVGLRPFKLGFNRVEGLSVSAGSRKNLNWDESMALSLYGQVGYAFKAHRWRGLFGAARQFALADDQLLEFGGEIYSLTDTKDDWIIGRTENDLAAFFFQRDYRDYYDREGFSLYVGHYVNSQVISGHLRLQYLNEIHGSMPNRTDWALFTRDRSFRVNPQVNDGRLNALRFGVNVSTVEPTVGSLQGWNILTVIEYSSPSMGSRMDYTQYVLDLRRYQPLSQYDNVNVRVRVGTSERDLPVQRVYEIGGIGTLPAFTHKIFRGNRMLLFNAEYALQGEVLSQLAFMPSSMLRGIMMLLFLDSGWTDVVERNEGPFNGFGGLSLDRLKTSIGFGFGSRNGNTRVGFAWRTDRAAPAIVFVRIGRSF